MSPSEPPADEGFPSLDADELLRGLAEFPSEIGPYRIVRCLGEGGMGQVFLAEQTTPVARQVAIKLIRLGMTSRAVLARFELERQSLARMSHHHVARIFDAGVTLAGQPYFVMEYVDGVPLTTWSARANPSVETRLAVFRQICAGVEHAHHKGIVHRDLKPANVLVSEEAGHSVVKVIDFGLARLLDVDRPLGETLTLEGHVLGTPEYMAPEQARLEGSREVDTRTDVHALGVMLFELLTGELPRRREHESGQGILELLQEIRETPTIKPSQRVRERSSSTRPVGAATPPDKLARRLSGDLDWIVLRAMAKEPDRRYQSPGALADDLQRHLDLLPVQAGPDSYGYRIRKLVRRHRGPLLAAALLLLTIVTGGAVAAWLAIDNARLAGAEATERRKAEALAAEQTRLAADILAVSAFQSESLRDVEPFEFADQLRRGTLEQARAEYARRNLPDAEQRLARLGELTEGLYLTDLARTILDRALLAPALTSARQRFAERPRVLARLLFATGESYRNLGLFDRAAPLLEEAHELFGAALGATHRETLDALHHVALVRFARHDHAGAEAAAGDAYRLRLATLGRDSVDVYHSLDSYAVSLARRGALVEAGQALAEAIAAKNRLLGDSHASTLSSRLHRADVLEQLKRVEDAEREYREVLALMQASDVYVGIAATNLGSLLEERGELADALHFTDVAYQAAKRRHGDDHPTTLVIRDNLASLTVANGDFAAGVRMHQQVLDASRRTFGSEHRRTLQRIGNYALCLAQNGRPEQALPLCETVCEARARMLGDDPETATAWANLGEVFEQLERPADAEPAYREALRLRLQLLGPDHPKTLVSLNRVGLTLDHLTRPADAIRFHFAATRGCERTWGEFDEETLNCRSCLGISLRDTGLFREAADELHRVLVGRRVLLGDVHDDTLQTARRFASCVAEQEVLLRTIEVHLDLLGWILPAAGTDHPVTLELALGTGKCLQWADRDEEAERWLALAAAGYRRTLGPEDPSTLDALHQQAVSLQVLGRLDDAERQFREVLRARDRLLGPDDDEAIRTAANLGYVLWASDQPADAAPLLRRVLRHRLKTQRPGDKAPGVAMQYFLRVVESAPEPGDAELLAPFETQARDRLPAAILPLYLRALGSTLALVADPPATDRRMRRALRYLEEAHDRLDELGEPALDERRRTALTLADLHDRWHPLEPGAGHAEEATYWREQAKDR